jgi:putative tryptophan/tyrosine transport system substrate-binding protein
MRRREFIGLTGSAAAWSVAVAAQGAPPVVGFLWYGAAVEWTAFVDAFRQGLEQTGFVEGRNVAIDFRWSEGQTDRQRALAAELISRRTAVIVTGTVGGLAAKAETSDIPIVFVVGADPVRTGLVASFGRPGGNVTGVSFFSNELGAKRLGLVHELFPQATLIAVLMNPGFPDAADRWKELHDAARALGLQIRVFNASTENEIENGLLAINEQRADALVVAADPFFTARRSQIVSLVARHAIPAVYDLREWATEGGLISYGTDLTDAFRQSGIYAGKILKGMKPADLPVIQSTKFELVVNLKTAKALGLTIPQVVLARADEVIE